MISRIIISLLFAVLLNWSISLQFVLQIEKDKRTRIIMIIMSIALAFIGGFILYG